MLSDKYIMVLYTYCLSARKTVAFENIELNDLSEVEFSMVKLESVWKVLFDDMKFEDGKLYAEFWTYISFVERVGDINEGKIVEFFE